MIPIALAILALACFAIGAGFCHESRRGWNEHKRHNEAVQRAPAPDEVPNESSAGPNKNRGGTVWFTIGLALGAVSLLIVWSPFAVRALGVICLPEPIRRDLPDMVSFVLAGALAWFPGAPVVQRLILRASPDQERALLSRAVGTVECLLYIYSVMVHDYSTVAGWLVLKGFYGWIDPRLKRRNLSTEDIIELYYSYILGNGYSLLLGLGLGQIGVLTASFLRGLP